MCGGLLQQVQELRVCVEAAFAGFEGGACRGQEQHFVQPGLLHGCLCNGQVTGVHRVKGASEQASLHARGKKSESLQAFRILVGQEATDGHLHILALCTQAAVVVDEGGEVAIVLGCLGDALLTAVCQDVEVQLSMQVSRALRTSQI